MMSRILAALALLVLAGPAWGHARSDAFHVLKLDALNEPLPRLLVSDGGPAARLSWPAGRPLILHFWATWCQSCADELPDLKKAVDSLGAGGAVFVAVSVDEEAARGEVARFLARASLSGPAWIARKDGALEPFLTWGLPATYFIMPDGRLVARALGRRSWSTISGFGDLVAAIFSQKR